MSDQFFSRAEAEAARKSYIHFIESALVTRAEAQGMLANIRAGNLNGGIYVNGCLGCLLGQIAIQRIPALNYTVETSLDRRQVGRIIGVWLGDDMSENEEERADAEERYSFEEFINPVNVPSILGEDNPERTQAITTEVEGWLEDWLTLVEPIRAALYDLLAEANATPQEVRYLMHAIYTGRLEGNRLFAEPTDGDMTKPNGSILALLACSRDATTYERAFPKKKRKEEWHKIIRSVLGNVTIYRVSDTPLDHYIKNLTAGTTNECNRQLVFWLERWLEKKRRDNANAK